MNEINYKPVQDESDQNPVQDEKGKDSTPGGEEHWGVTAKIIFTFVVVIVAALMGYLLIHWWIFSGFDKVLDVSVLKGQINAVREQSSVKDQLQDLGYEFDGESVFQMNNPSSTTYHADVLGSYEPVKTEEGPTEDGYYFYDQEGTVRYFTTDEENNIDPDSIIPLLTD